MNKKFLKLILCVFLGQYMFPQSQEALNTKDLKYCKHYFLAASPTKLGKELRVFLVRIETQLEYLKNIPHFGKLVYALPFSLSS